MDRRTLLRTAGIGALGLAAGPVLTACSGGSSSSGSSNGKTTLTFPTWQADEAGVKDWWKKAISDFESKNPNVTIELSAVPYASYVDTLTTRFSANKPPDIVHLPTTSFGTFASQGWLANLDKNLAGTDIVANWTAAQQTMKWQGHYIGVLLLAYAPVLYYNEQMLTNAGVTAPTTMDELLSAAQKMTGNGVYGFGAATTTDPNVTGEMTWFAYGQGGGWSKGDQLTFDSPATVTAMDVYRKATAYSPKGIKAEQKRTLFLDGKVAMMIDGPFVWSSLSKASASVKPHLKAAAAPFPQQPGYTSNSIHMPASLSGAKRDLVWQFIRSLTTPEMQAEYAQMYAVPALRKGAVTAAVLDAQPQLKLFQQVLEQSIDANPDNQGIVANYTVVSKSIVDAGVKLQTTSDSTGSIMSNLQSTVAKEIK